MPIAIAASVTQSIAEATVGLLSAISGVVRVRTSVSVGRTSERPGLSSTSSKVSASRRLPFDAFVAIANSFRPQAPGLLNQSPCAELARADSTQRVRMKAQSGARQQKSVAGMRGSRGRDQESRRILAILDHQAVISDT